MSHISSQNFPDFALRDISTNCLQLFGFLPEQSGRKSKEYFITTAFKKNFSEIYASSKHNLPKKSSHNELNHKELFCIYTFPFQWAIFLDIGTFYYKTFKYIDGDFATVHSMRGFWRSRKMRIQKSAEISVICGNQRHLREKKTCQRIPKTTIFAET